MRRFWEVIQNLAAIVLLLVGALLAGVAFALVLRRWM
jgi:hypothetical protein